MLSEFLVTLHGILFWIGTSKYIGVFFYILFHYWTNRSAVAPAAAVQRIDGRSTEAQAVTVGSAARQSRPRVAGSAHSEQRPWRPIADAGGREEV